MRSKMNAVPQLDVTLPCESTLLENSNKSNEQASVDVKVGDKTFEFSGSREKVEECPNY